MATLGTAERRNYIIRKLSDQGHLSVTDLAGELSVSGVTIRKDLQYLEERNILVRTHGGALTPEHFVHEMPFDEKAKRNVEEKKRIGKRAAELVSDQDSIILDSGSTTLQITRHLRDRRDLTVATNSLHVALETMRLTHARLLMLGGVLRRNSASIVGPCAEAMMRDHAFRLLFLAGDGFDVSFGLTTTDEFESRLNQLMMDAADTTVVVLDSSKFGRRGLCRIAGADEIDTVITDEGIPDSAAKMLDNHGVQVIIA